MHKTQLKKLEILLNGVGDMALKRRARQIILGIDPKNNERILDIGCGDGFYLFLLSNLGVKLTLYGSDFDPAALKSAKVNLSGKKIKLLQADLMKKLPFKDNFFDKVVMSEVAEHLPNDVKGLKEVLRVLKPGGVLCLTVPNANYPFFWDPVNKCLETFTGSHIKDGFWAGLWFNHLRLYKPEQIEEVIKKAKFEVLNKKSLTFWCLPFNHHLVNFAARLIYGGALPSNVVSKVSKYKINVKRPLWVNIGFGFFGLIDKLNDLYQPKNSGVGVFIRAAKRK